VVKRSDDVRQDGEIMDRKTLSDIVKNVKPIYGCGVERQCRERRDGRV
jgi:hypothetical protein